jgi:hypothetical protein
MITELGLHVDSRTPYSAKQNLSTEDIEVRRRLFWAAFGMEFLKIKQNKTGY